jgi:hypothetical protein
MKAFQLFTRQLKVAAEEDSTLSVFVQNQRKFCSVETGDRQAKSLQQFPIWQ